MIFEVYGKYNKKNELFKSERVNINSKSIKIIKNPLTRIELKSSNSDTIKRSIFQQIFEKNYPLLPIFSLVETYTYQIEFVPLNITYDLQFDKNISIQDLILLILQKFETKLSSHQSTSNFQIFLFNQIQLNFKKNFSYYENSIVFQELMSIKNTLFIEASDLLQHIEIVKQNSNPQSVNSGFLYLLFIEKNNLDKQKKKIYSWKLNKDSMIVYFNERQIMFKIPLNEIEIQDIKLQKKLTSFQIKLKSIDNTLLIQLFKNYNIQMQIQDFEQFTLLIEKTKQKQSILFSRDVFKISSSFQKNYLKQDFLIKEQNIDKLVYVVNIKKLYSYQIGLLILYI